MKEGREEQVEAPRQELTDLRRTSDLSTKNEVDERLELMERSFQNSMGDLEMRLSSKISSSLSNLEDKMVNEIYSIQRNTEKAVKSIEEKLIRVIDVLNSKRAKTPHATPTSHSSRTSLIERSIIKPTNVRSSRSSTEEWGVSPINRTVRE